MFYLIKDERPALAVSPFLEPAKQSFRAVLEPVKPSFRGTLGTVKPSFRGVLGLVKQP
jgi:hypothetical protein